MLDIHISRHFTAGLFKSLKNNLVRGGLVLPGLVTEGSQGHYLPSICGCTQFIRSSGFGLPYQLVRIRSNGPARKSRFNLTN